MGQQDALVQGRVWTWEGIAARAEMLPRPRTLLVKDVAGGEEAHRCPRSNSRRKWGMLQKLKEQKPEKICLKRKNGPLRKA